MTFCQAATGAFWPNDGEIAHREWVEVVGWEGAMHGRVYRGVLVKRDAGRDGQC
jgi:hypothetical protein